MMNIRGDRQLSDRVLYVFIGQEDVSEMGGWPITRDYYAYMIHLLSQAGARVIAVDIMFERKHPQYREFDQELIQYAKAADNFCVPLTFSELTQEDSDQTRSALLPTGHDPVFPMLSLKESVTAVGFSNFGNEVPIRSIPLIAQYKDSLYYSFGLEMARLSLGYTSTSYREDRIIELSNSSGKRIVGPVNPYGYLRLNHFGNIENIDHVGFLELLSQLSENHGRFDLSNKIVLLGVNLPGVSSNLSTPLTNSLPASLIHATVAENIIFDNYLTTVPLWVNGLITIFLLALAYILWFKEGRTVKYILVIVAPIIFLVMSMFLFIQLNLIIPLVSPMLAYLSSSILFILIDTWRTRRLHRDIHLLMENQIRQKEDELHKAKEKLIESRSALEDKTKDSEELHETLRTQEKTILLLENQVRDLQGYISPRNMREAEQFENIIYAKDGRLAGVLELVNRIRDDDIPVLIIGQTGSGKEMIARALHQTSHRSDQPFIAVNCGALSETLLESELFGHEKGSFTGAVSRRKGRFELANGGTIFLDEITETSPSFQAKLLRVLQDGVFERLGSENSLQIDVRIIAASNKDIQSEMNKGNFRADLYYRLNGFMIQLPSLKERKEDIPLLVDHFLHKHQYSGIKMLSEQAMQALHDYHWPGNVRELENAIRRSAILAQSEHRDMIRLNDLPPEIEPARSEKNADSQYRPLHLQILETLRSYRFSHSAITKTAKVLGNRDRGTITEYLRGICFESLVENNFNIEDAAQKITGIDDKTINKKIEKKISAYLDNLYPLPDDTDLSRTDLSNLKQFKGLPKKYHPSLLRIIHHLREIDS